MSVLSEVGLIFIMFLIGLEFDFGHLVGSTRSAFSISAAGIILPFSLGIPLGRLIHSQMNLHVNKTRLGALTITAAAVNDAVGWLLLALISAVAVKFTRGACFSAYAPEVQTVEPAAAERKINNLRVITPPLEFNSVPDHHFYTFISAAFRRFAPIVQ